MKCAIGVCFVVILASCSEERRTIGPPCMRHYGGLIYKFPQLTHIPPLLENLPLEIQHAYKRYDNLIQSTPYHKFNAFVKTLGYQDDTLFHMIKYIYGIVDYNPIKFKLYADARDWRKIYRLSPGEVEEPLIRQIRKHSSQATVDESLIRAHIIARALVTDTATTVDPGAGWAKTEHRITCTLIDPIKGKVLPALDYDATITSGAYFKKFLQSETTEQPAVPGAQFKFQYRLEWRRTDNEFGPKLADANGVPWVIKGREYIVFLQLKTICSGYYTLSPISGKGSHTRFMYPILDGIVQDTENDLGFGVNPTVEQCVNALRARVTTITIP